MERIVELIESIEIVVTEVRTKEMENSMMDLWPVDPGYMILGLAVLTLILLIIVVISA